MLLETDNTHWKWKLLSRVRLFATPWTVVHGILHARILEWVAFPFFRGSSQPRDQTQVSCIASGFFYQLSHKGSPRILEWVAYPFSSWSFWPRNQSQVSSLWILYQLSYQGCQHFKTLGYLHFHLWSLTPFSVFQMAITVSNSNWKYPGTYSIE